MTDGTRGWVDEVSDVSSPPGGDDAPQNFLPMALSGGAAYAGGVNQNVSRGEIPTTLLVENMMGAWGQRVDTLMALFQHAISAIGLFRPEMVAQVYADGTASEQWMFYWNRQRG